MPTEEDLEMMKKEVPLFNITLNFNEICMPKSATYRELIYKYRPPPLGQSAISDFNPTCHLETEEPESDEEENYDLVP